MSRLKLFLPLALFLVLAGFLWKGLALDPSAMPSALIDRPMPAFVLSSLEQPDRQVTQNELPKEVMLLNVWATWCPSCVVEHPYLIRIARDEQIPIIGIDYKDERAKALQWLEQRGDPYRLNLFDVDGKLGIDLGVFGAPETYIVDHLGIIRYRHVGVVDDQVWQRTLKPIVDELRARTAG